MKEYQFKVSNSLWLDVHAETEEEAVETLNAALHLLDEPLPAPGRIQRVQLDVREPVSKLNIVSIYDLDTGEDHTPNKASRCPACGLGEHGKDGLCDHHYAEYLGQNLGSHSDSPNDGQVYYTPNTEG